MTVPHDDVFLAAPEEQLICRILRGEASPWPAAGGAPFEQRFLQAWRTQGMGPLVHHCLRLMAFWDGWPATVRELLIHDARMQAAADMIRERELAAVLAAFADAGVATLILKGAALAYSHYPEPALRTRCDTDVLVAPDHRDVAMRVLDGLGYRRPNAVSGTLVSYEECYSRRSGNLDHVVDLHWQINNGQVFAHALAYQEALERSVPVPQLGVSARTLYPPHALLLACMHRAAHLGVDGPEGNRLIWLYDIHLLADAMKAPEWRDFVALCVEKAMCGITLDAFADTRQAFGTEFPAEVMTHLARPSAGELSATYLHADRGRLLMTDLRALSTWKERATLLRESLFPPADYVLAKYESSKRWLLPWWYIRRAAEGARKFSRS